MNAPVICTGQTTPWSALSPGIEMQIYYADETSGIWTVKIMMHAGSTLMPHRHVGASEFYILEGVGTHKEAGEFERGTYAFEPEGAVHSPVHAEDDILLYMTSYGPGVFVKSNGDTLYVGDAKYFKSQMEMSPFMRKLKRFVLITCWKLIKGKR